MTLNIRRRFMVRDDVDDAHMPWKKLAGVRYTQGFLNTHPERTVSVRIGERGGSLIVASKAEGPLVPRFEYDVPVADAYQMLQQCEGPRLERLRRRFRHGDRFWRVDEYLGDNAGLAIAEVELGFVNDAFDRPRWVGDEITGVGRFELAALLLKPYRSWDHASLSAQSDLPERALRGQAHEPLDPCPFCGKVASLRMTDTVREKILDPSVWVFNLVRCDASPTVGGCGAMGGWEETPELAAARWSNRSNLAAASHQVVEEILESRQPFIGSGEGEAGGRAGS